MIDLHVLSMSIAVFLLESVKDTVCILRRASCQVTCKADLGPLFRKADGSATKVTECCKGEEQRIHASRIPRVFHVQLC